MTVGLGVGVGLVFAANCGGTGSKHCLNMKVICINFMHAGRGVFGGYAGKNGRLDLSGRKKLHPGLGQPHAPAQALVFTCKLPIAPLEQRSHIA